MAKRKKKSKAAHLAGGIAALALIGALIPSEEPQEVEHAQPSAIIEEVETPPNALVEEFIEEQGVIEEPTRAPVVEPDRDPASVPKKDNPAEESAAQEPATVEIDPEKAFREKLMQYTYVGSSESDKYHYPKCRWTDTINDSNLVHFDTEEEAAAAGYVPCGSCKP